MERRRPRTCLALLWGCVLAAAAAQGKEGESVRAAAAPARPGPPASPAAAPPRAPCAPPRATLETDPAPPSPGAPGFGRRAGRDSDQPGTPRFPHPGLWKPRGSGPGARGSEAAGKGTRRAGHAVAAPAPIRERIPAGARGVPWKNGASGGLSVRGLGFSVIRIHLTRLLGFGGEGISGKAPHFGAGAPGLAGSTLPKPLLPRFSPLFLLLPPLSASSLGRGHGGSFGPVCPRVRSLSPFPPRTPGALTPSRARGTGSRPPVPTGSPKVKRSERSRGDSERGNAAGGGAASRCGAVTPGPPGGAGTRAGA